MKIVIATAAMIMCLLYANQADSQVDTGRFEIRPITSMIVPFSQGNNHYVQTLGADFTYRWTFFEAALTYERGAFGYGVVDAKPEYVPFHSIQTWFNTYPIIWKANWIVGIGVSYGYIIKRNQYIFDGVTSSRLEVDEAFHSLNYKFGYQFRDFQSIFIVRFKENITSTLSPAPLFQITNNYSLLSLWNNTSSSKSFKRQYSPHKRVIFRAEAGIMNSMNLRYKSGLTFGGYLLADIFPFEQHGFGAKIFTVGNTFGYDGGTYDKVFNEERNDFVTVYQGGLESVEGWSAYLIKQIPLAENSSWHFALGASKLTREFYNWNGIDGRRVSYSAFGTYNSVGLRVGQFRTNLDLTIPFNQYPPFLSLSMGYGINLGYKKNKRS